MSTTPGGPMNHLSARRRGRTPLHHSSTQPFLLPQSQLPILTDHVQDCYLDSGPVDVCAVVADPYIVSHIMTGYSDRSLELSSGVLVVLAGTLEPKEPDQC